MSMLPDDTHRRLEAPLRTIQIAPRYQCKAWVRDVGGVITHGSCKTGRPLIDDGGSPSGDRDDYICPDCGHSFSVYYEG